jgi:uncharacterized protein YbjQ (UPF0145 family)
MDELGRWLQENQLLLGMAVAALAMLVVVSRVLGRIRRLVKRRRPARLHTKLRQYGDRTDAEVQADNRAAAKIIATSSTEAIVGYDMLRQIEAVFVEGHRSQEQAVAALKAAAGSLGANAITNLTQHRSSAGRCVAQGDAVLIRPPRRKPGATERSA